MTGPLTEAPPPQSGPFTLNWEMDCFTEVSKESKVSHFHPIRIHRNTNSLFGSPWPLFELEPKRLRASVWMISGMPWVSKSERKWWKGFQVVSEVTKEPARLSPE